MVGVADTGLDVTNPEMLDANGKSRVAWMLDLSLEPLGVHADLEKKFGIADAQGGTVTGGAVLSKDMIDALLAPDQQRQLRRGEREEVRALRRDRARHARHGHRRVARRGRASSPASRPPRTSSSCA